MLTASAITPAPKGPVLKILGAMPIPVAAAYATNRSGKTFPPEVFIYILVRHGKSHGLSTCNIRSCYARAIVPEQMVIWSVDNLIRKEAFCKPGSEQVLTCWRVCKMCGTSSRERTVMHSHRLGMHR